MMDGPWEYISEVLGRVKGDEFRSGHRHRDTMLSAALFYLVAVICSATWTHALPLYPESSLEPQTGKTLLKLFSSFQVIFLLLISSCHFLNLLTWSLVTQHLDSHIVTYQWDVWLKKPEKWMRNMFHLNRFHSETSFRSGGRHQCCRRRTERCE